MRQPLVDELVSANPASAVYDLPNPTNTGGSTRSISMLLGCSHDAMGHVSSTFNACESSFCIVFEVLHMEENVHRMVECRATQSRRLTAVQQRLSPKMTTAYSANMSV